MQKMGKEHEQSLHSNGLSHIKKMQNKTSTQG